MVLGPGKTGALVAEVARERGHHLQIIDADVNENAAWLTPESLRDTDVVIDFTTPDAVLANIDACVRARKTMVVGTTGWYGEMERVRHSVEAAGTGFVFGANFSYGVNLFFEIARIAAAALHHDYSGHITETHHVHKKDAPSGTAIALQNVVEQASGVKVEISSQREGEVIGIHAVELASAEDRIVLTHEVKSRRTFAKGAVLAAEWVAGKSGFYDFREIFNQV